MYRIGWRASLGASCMVRPTVRPSLGPEDIRSEKPEYQPDDDAGDGVEGVGGAGASHAPATTNGRVSPLAAAGAQVRSCNNNSKHARRWPSCAATTWHGSSKGWKQGVCPTAAVGVYYSDRRLQRQPTKATDCLSASPRMSSPS